MPSNKIIVDCKEMEKILKNETMGFLGLSMDGMPYVLPLTYVYIKGKILFHCALTGKKLDYLKANQHVCFTVGKQFGKVCRHPQGAACHVSHDSVICYGIARVIDDLEERLQILNTFNHSLQPDAENIPPEVITKCYAVEIKILKMTGRSQRRGTERTYWEYNFE